MLRHSLNNLAMLYEAQGRYADAEPLFKRALAIREKALGPDHPDVAVVAEQSGSSVRKTGALCRCRTVVQALAGNMGKSTWSRSSRCCDFAEQSWLCSIEIKVVMPMPNRSTSARWRSGKKHSVPIIPMLRRSLNNLATLYGEQGRYAEAEPLYKRSLAIWEKALGPDHPDVALSLNNLADLYRAQGRYC